MPNDGTPTDSDLREQQAEELLLGCLEQEDLHPAEELERLCAANPGLAEDLRHRFELLAAMGLVDGVGDREPRQFGDFELLRRLGEGSFGVVYLARQRSLDRRVALKLLRPGVARADVARARFQTEVQATARLEHAGICPLLDAGEVDGIPYLAMRYVPGETLGKKIARAQRCGEHLPVDQVLRWGEQVARALHAAHAVGLVHRDVKPGNVLVDQEGTAFLLDFGLARMLDEDRKLTRSGQAVGTPAYLAPEQIEAGVPVGPRTDVYALGAALYELLTLRCPFDATKREGLYRAILSGRPMDPRRFNRMISPDLRTVLMKAMEPEVDRRYPSAAEMADDLARAGRGEAVHARPLPAAVRMLRWCRRNRTASAGLLALLMGFVVAMLALAESGRSLAIARAGALVAEADDAAARHETTLAALLALESAVLDPDPRLGAARLGELLPDLRERAVFGHPKAIGLVQASPDGRYLLTGCMDHRMRLWSTEDGPLARPWVSDELPWAPWEVRFRGDGKRFLAGMWWHQEHAAQVRVWDIVEGTPHPLCVLDVPMPDDIFPRCTSARFRPDDSLIAAFSPDTDNPRTLVCCFPEQGSGYGDPRPMPVRPDGHVYEMDVGADGRVLVPGSEGTVYLWDPDVDSAEVVARQPGRLFFARWLGEDSFVTATGRRGPYGQLPTVGSDFRLRFWRLGSEQPVAVSIPHGGAITALDTHGNHVVTASEDQRIRLWSKESEKIWDRKLDDVVTVARFATDGSAVVSGTHSGMLYVHDLEGRQVVAIQSHRAEVTQVLAIRDRDLLASASRDSSLRLWSLQDAVPRFRTIADPVTLMPSPAGDGFAVLQQGALHCLDGDGRRLQQFELPEATAKGLHFRPDGSRLVVTGSGWLDFFARDDVGWHRLPTNRPEPQLGYLGVACADEAGVVAPTRPVRSFDWDGREAGTRLPYPHVDAVEITVTTATARTADGTVAVAAYGGDQTFAIMVARGGQTPFQRLAYDPPGFVVGLRFVGSSHLIVAHRAGASLIAIPTGQAVVRYDITGVEKTHLDAWQGRTEDEARVLFGDRDGVRVFDVWSGELLAWLRVKRARSAFFLADGCRVITCDADGKARSWIVDQRELIKAARRQLWRDFLPEERERYAHLLER